MKNRSNKYLIEIEMTVYYFMTNWIFLSVLFVGGENTQHALITPTSSISQYNLLN